MMQARPLILTQQYVNSFILPSQRRRSRSVSARRALEPRVEPGRCDYTSCMQTAQPTGRPHRNQGLFSDHYLNATLPTRPDWRGLADEARPAMEEIARLLDSY